MMISTRGRYALRFLADLAKHQGDGYVTLKESAERQELSVKYLEIIAKELVRAKVITGLRGKGGGYRLTRPAGEINVLDVLRLTEENLVPVSCLKEDSSPCPRMAVCSTYRLWEGLNKLVSDYLSSYSVQDLADEDTDCGGT